MDVENLLLQTSCFIKNEYFIKYCHLLNTSKCFETDFINKHHVFPVCYYNFIYNLNNLKLAKKYADNDINNFLIKFSYKDHILAHYYLCLCCSNSKLKQKLVNAFYTLINRRWKLNDFNPKLLEKYPELHQIQKNNWQSIEKPVVCVELNKIFKSSADAIKFLKNNNLDSGICSCLKSNYYSTAGGYHWYYLGDEDRKNLLKEFENKSQQIIQDRRKQNKQVICIETQEIFKSLKEAKLKYGQNVGKAVKSDDSWAYGYHWSFLKDKEKQKKLYNFIGKSRYTKITKKCKCLELDLTFDSKEDAVKFFKNDAKDTFSLLKCLTGRQETYRGYHWKYISEEVI